MIVIVILCSVGNGGGTQSQREAGGGPLQYEQSEPGEETQQGLKAAGSDRDDSPKDEFYQEKSSDLIITG